MWCLRSSDRGVRNSEKGVKLTENTILIHLFHKFRPKAKISSDGGYICSGRKTVAPLALPWCHPWKEMISYSCTYKLNQLKGNLPEGTQDIFLVWRRAIGKVINLPDIEMMPIFKILVQHLRLGILFRKIGIRSGVQFWKIGIKSGGPFFEKLI